MVCDADYMLLAERLRALSLEGGSIDAAQVRLIGLDEIRIAAGDRWPRMRQRVRSGSLEILSRFVREEDAVIPAGDGFLIMLASGPPGYAQRISLRMREALLTFYLGDEALASLRPEVSAHALNADSFADLFSASLQKERASASAPDEIRDRVVKARLFALRSSKVAAEIFAPMHKDAEQSRLTYNPDFLLDGRHRNPNFVELDFAIRDAALQYFASGDRATQTVGLTVHASTLQHRRTRAAYLAGFANAPGEFRNHGFITIAEIERGTPLMSIGEWCTSLRAHVSRIGLDFHYSDHAVTGLSATGAWAAGFHLPTFAGAQKGPRAARMIEQLRFWSKTIHGQGLKLAVNGFQNDAFLGAARHIGVDIVTSDTLWPFSGAEEAPRALAA